MWSYHDNVGGAYIKTMMDLNIDKKTKKKIDEIPRKKSYNSSKF